MEDGKLIDIKELKKLKEIESIFLSFLELTPDFIYIKDINHKFLYASNSFAKITGFESAKELVGKTDFDIFDKEHAQLYFEKEKEIILRGKYITNIEEPYYNENNRLCYVSSSKRPMYDEEGHITGLFGISRDITDRKDLEEKLKEYANFDILTNLYNRRSFLEQGRKILEICKRKEDTVVLYFIDLNKFKPINDNHGHEAGDFVLKTVANRLMDTFRKSDLICRLGGDEFVVLTIMEDKTTSTANIKKLIKRNILKAIEFEDNRFKVACSVGVSFYPKDGDCIDELLSKADKQMYIEKRGS